MDFTLQQYDRLCLTLNSCAYRSISIGDFLRDRPDDKIVLLRHDVDSRPRHALKLAQIEQRYRLHATYFFRTVRPAFDAEAVRAVDALGHEVGYHYETLAQAGGDMEGAIQLFRDSLKRLRDLAPVEVAAMHGSPLSRYDNRAIWEQVTPADFGLIGEVYRDIDYRRVIYFNDTGRTWDPTRYNLRDVTDAPHEYHPHRTDDLIDLLQRGDIQQICISTHPERWNANPVMWAMQAGRDVTFNLVKLALKRVYRG